jgi:glycopeptide antibiotics resistance protein
VTFGYLVALAAIVLWPHHVDSGAGPLYALLLRYASAAFPFGIDATLNVVLLIPFGMILATVLPGRPFIVLGVVWAVPLLIEIAQGLFLPGRTSSVLDVAANTVGGVIGAGTVAVGRLLQRHHPSRHRT